MRKDPENRTIDTMSEDSGSVRMKLMFAVVTVRTINDLAALDIPKGVMDTSV